MPNPSLKIRRVTGSLGAEVTGVDLVGLSESVFADIHQAHLDYEVLFFPVLQLLGSTKPSFQVIEDGPDSPNEADYWPTAVTWAADS